jgi:hypothetical protein
MVSNRFVIQAWLGLRIGGDWNQGLSFDGSVIRRVGLVVIVKADAISSHRYLGRSRRRFSARCDVVRSLLQELFAANSAAPRPSTLQDPEDL